ncbi:hypothetical protein CHGG_07363 [Chaetomium globosum CBS 148.51]|uniref:Uncharacterized protein n=1 Tax=Chaetomium globosum (strain ATCC 6205 / CBS 148.51 / DSM 1962 / NBRC 6347 / NRRL 1970) TaxID=306901 RepID=Q2GXE1_CHAGB|nr:uncharacterized protein CHGG_07363 [Chaetomium globosum CBS 148.51]EAQ86110.1 hypothetical protein CHGG_07363 [Chaetomium globosum CBS 148.51]
MQFSKILSIFSLAAATSAVTVSYDEGYDRADRSLTEVACSDGTNGLMWKYNWKVLGDVTGFPNIGGSDSIPGWNSPNCGTCWSVSYNGNTIHVVAVDHAGAGLNLGLNAFNKLTNNHGVELGLRSARNEAISASITVEYQWPSPSYAFHSVSIPTAAKHSDAAFPRVTGTLSSSIPCPRNTGVSNDCGRPAGGFPSNSSISLNTLTTFPSIATSSSSSSSSSSLSNGSNPPSPSPKTPLTPASKTNHPHIPQNPASAGPSHNSSATNPAAHPWLSPPSTTLCGPPTAAASARMSPWRCRTVSRRPGAQRHSSVVVLVVREGGKVEVPAVEPLVDDAAGVYGGAVNGGEPYDESVFALEGAEGG